MSEGMRLLYPPGHIPTEADAAAGAEVISAMAQGVDYPCTHDTELAHVVFWLERGYGRPISFEELADAVLQIHDGWTLADVLDTVHFLLEGGSMTADVVRNLTSFSPSGQLSGHVQRHRTPPLKGGVSKLVRTVSNGQGVRGKGMGPL